MTDDLPRRPVSIDEVNAALSPFARLPLVTAKRTYGSTVFLEFGIPHIAAVQTRRRSLRRHVEGDVSVLVYSWEWSLWKEGRCIADAETVETGTMERIVRQELQSAQLGAIAQTLPDTLVFDFAGVAILRIAPSPELDPVGQDDCELVIRLPDRTHIGLDFIRGFTVGA